MTDYYVHLGYDWNRYKIGSVWGTSTSNDFDLQCALTTNQEPTSMPPWQAALFSFHKEDSLCFQIWDLTKKLSYAGPNSVTASIGLNYFDGTILDKSKGSKVVDLGKGLRWSTFDDNRKSAPKPCIGFAPELHPPSGLQSPWGSAFLRSSWVGPLTFLDPYPTIPIEMNSFIEMNFFVEVTVKGETRVFVEDPETIIGSGSQ